MIEQEKDVSLLHHLKAADLMVPEYIFFLNQYSAAALLIIKWTSQRHLKLEDIPKISIFTPAKVSLCIAKYT